MRILNKMKKTMLVLAASLFCANVAFADTWVSVIANGDFEGTEAASFVVKENGGANAGAFVAPAFADGIGKDGSRGIKVTSYAGATNDWDAQFWIAASNTLSAGTKYRVSFDYRASAAVNVGTQAHGEPGSYLHNDAIGNASFTTEWQHFEKEGVISGDYQSIAFNLSTDKANDVEFFFDNVTFELVEAASGPKNWVSFIANGDFEGTEAASFVVKENGGANAGAFVAPAFTDAIGKDGSRGIKVTSYAGATNDWDAQFWIAASKALPAGTEYRVTFDYRASAAVNVGTQAHGAPGSYLHNNAIGNVSFTTEWQHFEKSGFVSAEYQSIAFNLSADKANDVEFFFDNVTFEYVISAEELAVLAAVDTLNVLIAEVEAYQKTLDLTDPMQVSMNESLTTAIADAKAAAEAKESLEAVTTAEGFLNSVYVSVVGGIAGPVISAAEEVMASYENPTDEAGLGAAIQKVYEIYSALGTGMGDITYTVSDLAAAVEAVKVAQEAFIVENTPVEAEQLLKVLASYDFAAMDVTLATGASAGFAYNAGNGVFNEVFACTTEGLEAFAFQALAAANGKGWSIVNGTGLVLGSGAGRCAALTGLEAGQLVDVYFTGDNLYVGDNDTYPNAKNSAKDIAAIKDTLVAEAGHYQFLMKEDGALALELDRGNAITKIEVSAPATYVIASSWDFETLAPAEDGMTYLTTLADYEKVGQSGWNWASVIATEIGEGLAFTRTATSAKQMGFWLRTKGADKGLACQKDNHTLTVYGLTTGDVITLNTTANAIAGSYKGNFGGEWTAVEDAENGIYEYTMTADGDLNLTVAAGSWVKNITVKKLVQLEVKNKFDFETLAPAEDGMTYLTTLADYEKVGQSGWNWASVIATEIGEGLAFTRTATSAKQMGFWLRTKGADKGLACQKDNHTLTVYGLTTGDVITLNTTANAIAGSYKGNFGGEWTAVEDAENGVYEYTMTADGDLNLTVAAGSWIKNLSVVGPKPDIFVPEIVVSEHADSEVAFVTMTCATEGAEIHYTLNGGADLLYNDTLLLTSNAEIVAWATTEKGKSKTTTINVVAGYVVTPTATITAVDGVNRTVTLASATEGASIVYATSALEEVALTKEMFHKWDGVGADANQTADATTPELGVGVKLGAGGMVYGYSTVDYLHYADLTGAVKLVVEGTPGVQLRVLMNRVEHEGALTEVNVTIGTNGKAEVDFTGMEYVHLNAIKTGWGSAAGTITKLAAAYAKEGFEAYTEPFVISDNTTVWAIASKKSAIADSLTFASDTLVAELVAGTEVALNAPVFAKAVVDSLTQIEYAEKGLAAFMITSNQSSVLCAPTAKISYEFFALNQETGRVSETADLSGEYTDTLKALPYGLLKATASAEGYKSTESHIWLKVPVELNPIWTINFDSIATAQWVANDSADLIVDATYRDFVFNGKFRANMSADFKTASFGDSVLNNNFVLHDGQDWELRYRQGVVGLYNNQSGDRGFGFANLKKNQVIHVHYSDPAQAIFMDGPIVQDAALTDGNDVYYTVTGDGNASIAMNRFYYITKVGVYMNPALTQIPDFAITKVDGTTHYVGMTTATKGADIYYAIGHEEYSESQVLVNDTVGGVAPEYATKIDTTIVYGESKLYTEPVALDKTSYVRAYAWYQDVESEAREELIEAGMTVQIAQPVILYTGNTEAGEKQFTITVDNSEVISTPTTPIYYTLPGGEETLYDGGTITVKADAYGWMTAVAKLVGYEDSKAARRYIDARESYTEKYEVVDATLETIPAEAGDVEIDYSEDMNVEQLGATAFAGRVYFHRVVEAAVINVSLPTVFNNNCYVTDAAGNKLERGVDYVINEIKAAERPIDGVLTGNMAATAAKGYVVNFLNADLKGKEVIFVSAVKGNIAKGNFTYAQPEAGYKVVTNRTFAAATLDVPAYVLNAEGTAFELVENGAVVAPFQSVILASADICATVGSLSAADGIEPIAADKDVKEIKYFTVGGVEVEKPAAGVYIQQIIFTDGTVKSISVAGK